MTRADRYVLREFLGPFLVGLLLAVLLILMLQLQRATGGMVRGGIPLGDLLRPLWFDVPRTVTMAMPVAVALGASLAVNRLARDREVVVLRGTGRSLARCFAPILACGVVLSGVNVWISERWVPEAGARARAAGAGIGTVLGAGALPDARSRRLVGFAEARGDGRSTALDKVVVVEPEGILVAPKAEHRGGTLVLDAAVFHAIDARGAVVREEGPATRRIAASLDFLLPGSSLPAESTDLTFAELTRRARAARRQGDRAGAVTAETARWFKVALPTLCGAFALCAAPLALRFSSTGGFAGVLLSVVVVFVAWNTHLFLQAISLGGWIPPVACAFATHVLLVGTGLFSFRVLER